MALVLSMNPFCEPEAEALPPIYQQIWESEHCSKRCVSTSSSPGGDTQRLIEEPHYRRAPDHMVNRLAVSRISYFKRKFVEDEETVLRFRSYCHTVSPMLEERAHILHLSLEKLRFMDDPESFLRRSVLINNLLRRLRNEILLQSDWCFTSGPAATVCPHQTPAMITTLPPPAQQPCNMPPRPYCKRLRLLKREGPECVPACCCLYAAGRYLQLPLSIYEQDVYTNSHPSSSFSSTSSSSVRFPQLVDEDEEDSDEEEELDSVCPMLARHQAETREQNRTWDGLRVQSHRDEKTLERERERGKERNREKVRGGEVTVGVSQ
ncbi:SERTA domain-containing protein 4-like isoform X2 [Xyrauchen texanus]|uniref:SERTA domain-containing protein 4-like isoform X2 n=1 Tax=Xyrauchen texanus TaxID=154827 RepID=UPI0022421E2B|nr:SERTA domain-containing protein 4-like isoform X2 [Xyrauchen texanus]